MESLIRNITLYREGYFMSADEQRTAKAVLRLDRDDAKERLAILKYKAHEIAMELEGAARLLKETPEKIEFQDDCVVSPNYRGLADLIKDIKATTAELQRIENTLAQCQ
jgi:hypothetical protein